MRYVTHEFFDVFGIRPILGRSFTAEEDRPGRPNVILLSASLWKRMFDSDPTIIGHTVSLDDDPSYTVVGILPDTTFPDHKDLWCPLRSDPDKDDGGLGPMAAGRLKKGVTVGLLGAIALGRILSSMEFVLYDVGPADPLTLAGVPTLLSVTAMLACYLPARKAARVDPMMALRCE